MDNVTTTSISISWIVPDGSVVTSYEVMWTSDDIMEDEGNVTITNGSTNHIISDLRRDVSYIITVNATNSVGTSSSDIVTVQTEGEKLVVDATTATSISLSWTNAGLEADEYEVIWTSDKCPDDLVEGNHTVTGDDGSGDGGIAVISYNYIIEGLREGTSYNITITASNTPLINTTSQTQETGKRR